MATQTFNLSLPKELVEKLDAQAKRDFSSRSDYVRKAIINQLKLEQALETTKTVNKKSKNADNGEVIAAAKKILNDYRKDFENLAKR